MEILVSCLIILNGMSCRYTAFHLSHMTNNYNDCLQSAGVEALKSCLRKNRCATRFTFIEPAALSLYPYSRWAMERLVGAGISCTCKNRDMVRAESCMWILCSSVAPPKLLP